MQEIITFTRFINMKNYVFIVNVGTVYVYFVIYLFACTRA
jgi:hypothetical protein